MMKGYRQIAALLLVLSVLVSAAFAEFVSAESVITSMLNRGMPMSDIVISLEAEPDAQAFLARFDTNTLAFLHLLCERELERRGAPVSEAEAGQMAYVVNTNTDKFHRVYCKHADSIKENNRWDYKGSRDDLIRFKYVPCKECDP